MSDATFNRSNTLDGPFWNAAAVTPNDSADLARAPTDGIYVTGSTGTTSDVAVVMAGGATVTFGDVPHGTILRLRVDRVLATGTTATAEIVALYTA